ncbi:MAG TPA: class I SAM-dependent methyltransferase [Anaerolineales bacterium]
MIEYSFPRYLSAKKTVDDRALNRRVWESLSQHRPAASPERPLAVLEIGAGIGTMLERMLSWDLLSFAEYTAIDVQPENIAHAHGRLAEWSVEMDYQVRETPTGLVLEKGDIRRINAILQAADLFDFAAQTQLHGRWDLLVANAFLDLVDILRTLPLLFSLLRENGLFYFTLNFDGVTILEPLLDPDLDRRIIELYHRSMDERLVHGLPSGDSRSGRHLFHHLRRAGAEVLAAGSSDWVVFPSRQGYPDDEAYFLHFTIATIHRQLHGHPGLRHQELDTWVAERHAQIDSGELVYIAHQIDFLGRCNLTK